MTDSRNYSGLWAVLCILLCGCATNQDRVSAVLVSPSGEQYRFYQCTQLLATIKAAKQAQQDLKKRMASSGPAMSVVAGYNVELANQHGVFVAARNAARDKKCDLPADLAVDEPL